MSIHSHTHLERQLLLETTLFQEETTPETLSALLDQLEAPPAPFSPADEWARFQAAHPEHFPRRRRRVLPWAAAACLALAAALPAAGQLSQPAEAPISQGSASTAADRAVLYHLAGIAPLRAELPFDGELVEGPAVLPFEAEVYPLPFYAPEEDEVTFYVVPMSPEGP